MTLCEPWIQLCLKLWTLMKLLLCWADKFHFCLILLIWGFCLIVFSPFNNLLSSILLYLVFKFEKNGGSERLSSLNKDAKQLSRDSPGQSPCPFPLLQGGSLVLRVINCSCRWGRVFHGRE